MLIIYCKDKVVFMFYIKKIFGGSVFLFGFFFLLFKLFVEEVLVVGIWLFDWLYMYIVFIWFDGKMGLINREG